MKRHPMLAILTLAAIFSLGIPANSVQAQEAAEPQPSATVPVPVHDFGKVSKGKVLSYDFEIRNKGEAPLEITRVSPDCGCTVAQYDQVIAPGESGEVHAEVDTATLSGPTSRHITVFTNDPKNPALQLTFKVEVIASLNVTPGYARFQVVRGETEPGIVEQTIYAVDGSEFKVTGTESTWQYLSAEARPAKEDERHDAANAQGDQWIVDVEFDYNEAPVGPVAQEVVVHTSHPVQNRIVIPISGFVRPPMWSTPNEVDFGEVKLEKPGGFTLVVQNFLAEEIEITEVTSDLEGFEAEVLPVDEGRKFAVRCTIDPDEAPKGPFDTTVKIKTNTEKAPMLEVPLRGTFL